MIGSSLSKTLTLLKAELGVNLSIGTADDSRYYQMIETQQEWYASMFDWNQLADKWDAVVTQGAGGRYTLIPTIDYQGVTTSINFDRPVLVYVKYSMKWQEIVYGIGPAEYNVRDSELNPTSTQDPVMRWKFKPSDRTYFEVWPLSASPSQTIRFEGQRKVNTLRTANVLDPTKTLELDDRLIALAIAVDVLSAKEDPAVKAKSEKLNALWQTLRAAESSENRSFPLGGGDRRIQRRVVPITVG